MVEQAERYDRIASGYARWWAPVLTPAVAELVETVAPELAGSERIIDIGTGTGQLAQAVLTRWPGASVVGIDASGEMLRWPARSSMRTSRIGDALHDAQRIRGRAPVRGRGIRRRALVLRVPARPQSRPGPARGTARAPPGRSARLRLVA